MACAMCGYRDFRFIVKRKQFRIEKCLSCELVQVTNRPPSEKVYQIYDKAWFDTGYPSFESNGIRQRYVYLNFNNKLEQIERRIGRRGRLLDVGCSFGFFLEAARQRGWSVEGLDVSAHIVEYARSKMNLSVECAPISEAGFAKKSFDVITMWYVIEHLPNPLESIRKLSSWLCENGMLVVGTPNVDSNLARLQGRRWRNWLPPDHLLYFCPGTMDRLLNKCNLEMMHYETAVPYERYVRRMKLYGILDKMNLSDNVIYYARKVHYSHEGGDLLLKKN